MHIIYLINVHQSSTLTFLVEHVLALYLVQINNNKHLTPLVLYDQLPLFIIFVCVA